MAVLAMWAVDMGLGCVIMPMVMPSVVAAGGVGTVLGLKSLVNSVHDQVHRAQHVS